MIDSVSTPKFDVTVLGLGKMGTACARALLRKGYRVAVWNRTPEKSRALSGDGAVSFDSSSDAISASTLSIITVSDHSAVLAILQDPMAGSSLPGRLVLQTASCTVDELARQRHTVHGLGAFYVAGIFLTFPSGIGQAQSIAICAGDRSASERQREVLATLARFEFLGDSLPCLFGSFLGVGHLMMSTLVLYFEAAAVAQKFHVPASVFFRIASMAREETWRILSDSTSRISNERYDSSEACIDTLADGMPGFVAMLHDGGTPVLIAEAMLKQLQYACEMGGNGRDISFLAYALRAKSAEGREKQ